MTKGLLAPLLRVLWVCTVWLCAPPAAVAQNSGFQVNRYEPTTVGEWSFMVDHPWYSATRYFAGGFTLNYGHNPLVLGRRSSSGNFTQIDPILAHQLLGHLELAGSFLDRINLSASLPVTFLERGQALGGVAPMSGAAVGDPRFAAMVRIYRDADRSPFSVHAGAALWIPLRSFNSSLAPQLSEQTVRFMPKVALGGLWRWLRWSFTFAFLYRAEAVLGQTVSVGPELQFGLGGSYTNAVRRWAVGPELLLSSVVSGGNAFGRDYTSLEALLGGQYHIANLVQLGAAVGLGLLRQPGTPDVRFLLRLSYAPIRGQGVKSVPGDRDGDGISDGDDACPNEAGVSDPDRKRHGCPHAADQDGDGVVDAQDLCPQKPRGAAPDPKRLGCPLPDQDSDGVPDQDDACPRVAQGLNPDADRRGCPLPDRDSDGVPDRDDKCPDQPVGPTPDAARVGCPQGASRLPAAGDPPPDAAPDAPQDPLLRALQPIFFKHRRATIERGSLPALRALSAALQADPRHRKLLLRGHTDVEGREPFDERLSRERAEAVRRWLGENGVGVDRLETRAMGRSLPLVLRDDSADAGKPRQQPANRRVDFRPIEPPLSAADERTLEEAERKAAAAAVPASGDDSDPAEPGGPAPKRKSHHRGKRSRLDVLLDEAERAPAGSRDATKPADSQ